MTAAFLEPDDAHWPALLERVAHDVYHLPGYVQAAAVHEGGTPTAFYAEADEHALLIPLLLHPLSPDLEAPPAWRDAASPYGYPSPLLTPGCPPATFGQLMQTFHAAAAARDVISVFLRLHPLLPVPLEPLAVLGTVHEHDPTVYLDLTRPPHFRRDHRSDLRKLRRAGYTACVDAWHHVDAFQSIYADTMQRVQARPFYFFSDRYFAALRERLPRTLHLATVHAPEGVVASAGLFTATHDLVEFHLSGTTRTHYADAPSKLLIDHIQRWARDQGYRFLHLGGGLGGDEDALFLFKAGFSDVTAPFHTVRGILDPERYTALTHRARKRDPERPAAFFPAYRTRRPQALQ